MVGFLLKQLWGFLFTSISPFGNNFFISQWLNQCVEWAYGALIWAYGGMKDILKYDHAGSAIIYMIQSTIRYIYRCLAMGIIYLRIWMQLIGHMLLAITKYITHYIIVAIYYTRNFVNIVYRYPYLIFIIITFAGLIFNWFTAVSRDNRHYGALGEERVAEILKSAGISYIHTKAILFKGSYLIPDYVALNFIIEVKYIRSRTPEDHARKMREWIHKTYKKYGEYAKLSAYQIILVDSNFQGRYHHHEISNTNISNFANSLKITYLTLHKLGPYLLNHKNE